MNSSQLESERLTVSHEIIDRKKLIRRLILLRFSLSFLSFSRCRLDATGRIRKGKEILASNARRYAKSRESPVTSALLGLPLSASSAGGGRRGKWQFGVESPRGPAYSPLADTR